MLFEVGIFTSAIWLSGLLGEVTQSANQIVLNVSSFTFMDSLTKIGGIGSSMDTFFSATRSLID